jgi:superfamily II DNA or RNA helicase
MENSKIICYHSHLEVTNYTLGECPALEKSLSVYDKIYFKYIPKGFIYDEVKHSLLMPSGVNSQWVAAITGRPIEIDYDADPHEATSIRLTQMPRSDLQREAIAFLAGEGEFKNYTKYSQLVLNLDTGEGKTYAAIALICIKRMKALIIIHSNKIKHQWHDRFKDYTDIDEKSIFEFTGSSKCEAIINNPKKFAKYKVFITTHDTLRSFGNNYGWDQVHELFKALEVGIKIYDEAHLEFTNIVKIDCYSNTKYTYYLTATFGRSSVYEDFVFNRCFKSIPKYEQKERTEYEGKKYIHYFCFFYKSRPTIDLINSLKNKYGFDRNRYAEYQLESDPEFYPHIKSILEIFTVQHHLKTLILMTTIDGIESMESYIHNTFPDLKITLYHSKLKDKEAKERGLLGADVIISTMKSLGVGADIPGLRAVLNTESYKSKIITEQVLGRLRKPESGSSFYVELVDEGFLTLKNQQQVRSRVLKHLVGTITYVGQ